MTDLPIKFICGNLDRALRLLKRKMSQYNAIGDMKRHKEAFRLGRGAGTGEPKRLRRSGRHKLTRLVTYGKVTLSLASTPVLLLWGLWLRFLAGGSTGLSSPRSGHMRLKIRIQFFYDMPLPVVLGERV